MSGLDKAREDEGEEMGSKGSSTALEMLLQ